MIYFLRSRICKSVKVGWTIRFTDRLSQIRRGNFCDDVEVLGTITGDQEKEQEILEYLSPYQTHDEFFEDRQEVLNYISQLKKEAPIGTGSEVVCGPQ